MRYLFLRRLGIITLTFECTLERNDVLHYNVASSQFIVMLLCCYAHCVVCLKLLVARIKSGPRLLIYVVSNSEAVLLFLTGTTKAEIEFVSGGRLEDLGAENKMCHCQFVLMSSNIHFFLGPLLIGIPSHWLFVSCSRLSPSTGFCRTRHPPTVADYHDTPEITGGLHPLLDIAPKN